MEFYKEVERSIIKKYRREIWSKFVKNMRFMALAVGWSIFRTSVNHMMSSDPPPTPRPAKYPSMIPVTTAKGKEFSIGNESLPIESRCQVLDEDRSP